MQKRRCFSAGIYCLSTAFHDKIFSAGDRIVRTSTDRVTDRVTEKVTEKVTETENRLRILLREDPACTYEALSKKLILIRKTIDGLIESLIG